jgi:hypothetical protein
MVDIYGVGNNLSKAGAYGVYSDSNRHIEIVAQSSAGRRLFLDINGDVISSNVFPALEFHANH